MTVELKDRRNPDLAKIHIAKKQLGMDEATYRSMLWTVARVESAKDLDFAGRMTVLAHLRGLGFQDRGAQQRTPRRAIKAAPDKSRLIWRIREWLKVAVPARTDAYADGMSKRLFHVDQFTWCTPAQLHSIVAALEKDGKRHGWKLGGKDEPQRA